MFPKHWLHGVRLMGLLALPSCQLITGLDDLEVGVEGPVGAACLQGWETHDCRGQCGDPDDGIRIGCGNFLECYIEHDCLPDTCTRNVDDVCGNNKVQSGTDQALTMATAVVDCMCVE